MNDDTSPVAIQQRMAEIRAEGRDQASAVIEHSRQLTDWRYYVKRYPWACLGIAAAVGFLVVPRRLELVTPDAKTLEKLAKRNKLVVEANPEPRQRGGVLSASAGFLTHLLLREAVAFVGRELGARVTNQGNSSGGSGNGSGTPER